MIEQIPSQKINDVIKVQLKEFPDGRGRFLESFRTEWFPQVSWERIQMNRSDSAAGIVRGLHYHFKQVDYWYVPKGRIRVGLADLRSSSSTFKSVEVLELGESSSGGEFGLLIPVGVAHGFYSLTEVTLTYVVNNYYSGKDEFGVAWNDPQLNVPWGIENPIVSERDRNLPQLAQITSENLPR